MLAEEANFTPSHQPRHVKFGGIMQGSLTSSPHNQQPEEVALPPRHISSSHPEEIGLHMAAHQFRKMQEPEIINLKCG